MNNAFNLELVNGNWGIAAAALWVICLFYLAHEIIARQTWGLDWRDQFTRGMRVAVAIFTLSVGVCIRSLATYVWRHSGADIAALSQTWLLIGGVIAVIGFLCVIREISKPLYGNAPWIWTLVAMALFTVYSIVQRFFY